MTIWIDAQLSPSLAQWITEIFDIPATAIRDLGLRDSKDFIIFQAAKEADATVLTKDADFPHLLSQHGPPPKVIWLTCGNTSTRNLQKILQSALRPALDLLAAGEPVVEITGRQESA